MEPNDGLALSTSKHLGFCSWALTVQPALPSSRKSAEEGNSPSPYPPICQTEGGGTLQLSSFPSVLDPDFAWEPMKGNMSPGELMRIEQFFKAETSPLCSTTLVPYCGKCVTIIYTKAVLVTS